MISKKNLPLTFIVLVCLACGGSGTSSNGVSGLLFFNNTGVLTDPILYRMPKEGGTIVPVAGTVGAFEGSMDQALDVFTSDPSGNIVKIVSGVSTSLTTSTHDFRPCVTPDSSRVAFVSSRDGNNEVYVMAGTGIGQANVSNSSGNDSFPAISQDGTKVVFMSNRDGNDEIYIVDFAGTNLTRLTSDAGDDVTPAFTPDGSHIIFSSNRSGIYQIYRMDLTGANVTQLTTDANDKFHASFAIDNSGIFYYTASGTRQIWRCNVDGSNPIQLTNSATDCDKLATWVY